MKRTQQNRFKRTLENKRDELLGDIRGHREFLTIDSVNDPVDQINAITERDLIVRNVDQMHCVLREVESALEKLKDGNFGVCVQCGGNIPAKRLEAVPWSPLCVLCQERAEQPEWNGEGTGDPYALAG